MLWWWGPTSPKQRSRAPHLFSLGITWSIYITEQYLYIQWGNIWEKYLWNSTASLITLYNQPLHIDCILLPVYCMCYIYTGVGGIEAEAVMLGQCISMVLPQVCTYDVLLINIHRCTHLSLHISWWKLGPSWIDVVRIFNTLGEAMV